MSVADELTKLVALRDSGVLTQEEFDQQRAILLDAGRAAATAPSPTASAPTWGSSSQAPVGMACGRCHKPLSPVWRGKCNHCGATYAEFPPITSVPGLDPVPSSAYRAPRWTLAKKLAVIGAAVLALAVVASLGGGNRGNGSAPERPVAKQLVGTFVEWVPVDEANGYAYITIKNNGSTTVTAECTVSVRNDFGDFGFDSLVGEEIGPGETFSGRLAISVSKGSFLINEGEVKDC